MSKGGLILQGRKISYPATARFYAPFYKPVKGSGKAGIREFAHYFTGNMHAGRRPILLKKNMAEFAAHFGARPPKGSRIAMLPRKFAEGLDLRGKRPIWRTKNMQSEIWFFDFLTDEWLQEIQDLEDTPQEQRDAIEMEVRKFVNRLPKGLYSVLLMTGDYGGVSVFDRRELIEFLTDLMMRFIRSKSVEELASFAVGVYVTTKRRK